MKNGEGRATQNRNKIWRYYYNVHRWAEENYLNYRALKQGQNIKSQLKELVHKVDIRICEKFLTHDPICQYYKQNKTESSKKGLDSDGFERYEKVRMALTAGTFFSFDGYTK